MIGIIGAGISGLSAAWFLQKRGIPYRLFEASERPGGFIQTKISEGRLLEKGPNSLLVDPETEAFLHEIGLADEIITANPVSKNRFILKNGRYAKLNPGSLFFGDFLSSGAKWSLIREIFRPARHVPDETLGDFISRRFCPEITDYLLNPFVAGIYAGSPDQLIAELSFPQLVDYEQKYGSVLRGVLKNAGGTRKKTISFRNGMEALPEKLAEHCPPTYQTAVRKLHKTESGEFCLETDKEDFFCDQIILSLPAQRSADLLHGFRPEYRQILKSLDCPTMTVIHAVFDRADCAFQFDGFGGLHPKKEKRFTAGMIWSGSLFPGRCADSEILLTAFVGGSQYRENASLPPVTIRQKAEQEMRELFGISGNARLLQSSSWPQSIPQYDRNAGQARAVAEELEAAGIFVAAAWNDGISVPDRIRSAKRCAELCAK